MRNSKQPFAETVDPAADSMVRETLAAAGPRNSLARMLEHLNFTAQERADLAEHMAQFIKILTALGRKHAPHAQERAQRHYYDSRLTLITDVERILAKKAPEKYQGNKKQQIISAFEEEDKIRMEAESIVNKVEGFWTERLSISIQNWSRV